MGHNPNPAWTALWIPIALIGICIGLSTDIKTCAQDGKDKKDVPAKEAPAKVEIDASKIVLIKQKGEDTLILPPKGLAYEGVPSLYTKEKPKVEDGGDGWILIRKNKACVVQESGTKMSLQLGGVKIKYVFIGLPEGYYATYK